MRKYNYIKKRKKVLGICRVYILAFAVLSVLLCLQLYAEKHFLIYENTLRFHVRADSDDPLEQRLKLAVRDSVLSLVRSEAAGDGQAGNGIYQKFAPAADGPAAMEQALMENQELIRKTAEGKLKELGYVRQVRVHFVRERFPVRRYGRAVFPAGRYRAMRIDIGQGKGHNWWCALYPDLCYNKKEYALSREGKRRIREKLSGLERFFLIGNHQDDSD